MANIHAIRTYNFYGTEYADILYSKDGYITRCYTMPVTEIPKTAKKWLKDKTGIEQYDKVHKRNEVIYK